MTAATLDSFQKTGQTATVPPPPDVEQLLRAASLRVTRPRVAVLAAVQEHPHASTDTVIEAVRRDLGEVSHQAVYDVLRALTTAGLLRRIQPSGSVARYESRVGDNHHHVVCRSCGTIADVDCAVDGTPLPHGVRRPRVRHRRGRGRLLGHLPAVRGRRHPRDHLTARDRPPIRLPNTEETDVTDVTDGVTEQGSESENPAIDAPPRRPGDPAPTRTGGPTSSTCRAAQALPRHQPAGCRVRLRRPRRDPRRRRAQARHRRGDDDLAGLLARRLRPLRPVVHPDELALRRHLPDPGRPRRRGRRPAAVRPAQQLARQRQPRQGPPHPVAGQAEVRPVGVVGRPARARRQRGARGHGAADLRVRLRPRGRLGAGGGLLGSRGRLARRRALQRRPRARPPSSAPCRWA